MREKYMKQIKYEDIKTPKTVEEFRENLKKYFICTGNDWSTRNELMVQGNNRILIDELNSLSDLYNKDLCVPCVVPYVDFDINSIKTEETLSMMGSRNFEDVMKDESRFKIYDIDSAESHSEFMSKSNAMWSGIDNQIYRQFYVKTLGDFSGYLT
jgi:hypothetical protein